MSDRWGDGCGSRGPRGRCIRHAPAATPRAVGPLAVPVIEPAFRAALVPRVCVPPVLPLRRRAAARSTVRLPPVAGPTDGEHRPAPRPAAAHRAPPLGPGAHAAPPRRRRRVRRRRGGTGETDRPAWEDGGARPGGLRSRVHGFRRPRDRTRARRSGGIAVGVTIWARAGGASGHGARRGVCAWRRRYQPTEARPSTPLPVPPINGLSRRCASTPNSNVTPSPPNAARL